MAKCSECGFLAIQNLHDRRLIEAEATYRESGELILIQPDVRIDRHPVCLMRACNLRREANDSDSPKSFLPVIQGERDCRQFTEWQQGMSPQEHRDMLQQKMLLEWQQQRDEDDRKWRERQEAIQEKRHVDALNMARAAGRREMLGWFVAGILGAIGTVAAGLVIWYATSGK